MLSVKFTLRNARTPTIVGAFVPGTGIEPALPCDNQILSLTRLPVPPSGQRWNEAAEKAGRNITDLAHPVQIGAKNSIFIR